MKYYDRLFKVQSVGCIPSKNPGLGFEEVATGLAGLITNSEPRFSIAIFGPWGSGKTTLMNTIKRKLENHKNVIIAEFSAWRYEREEHLVIPLLDTIRAALVEWAENIKAEGPSTDSTTELRFSEAGLIAAQTVGKVMASVLAGVSFKIGIPGAPDLSYDANKALDAARRYSREENKDFSTAPSIPSGEVGPKGVLKWFFKVEEKEDRFTKRLFDPNLPQSFYHACFSALEGAFIRFAKDTNDARIVVFVDYQKKGSKLE